jgi:heme-degrading monooxygenase HmoA
LRERTPGWRRRLDGASGFLSLFDRDSGKGLGITLFESEQAITDAGPVFEQMGEEVPEALRGRRVSVDVYEVVIREGGPGAQAVRVSDFEGPPERMDEGLRHAQESVLPNARELPGWNGCLVLADRSSGRVKSLTFWESAEAMRASEKDANRLRQDSAAGAGETITGVERYEVGYADDR